MSTPSNRANRPKRPHADGPCPIMRTCGGCEWIGLPYKKQLKRKQAAMDELFLPLLERFGWNVEVSPILGMDTGSGTAPRAFRHKAATPFAPGPNGSVQCGFFARGTHRIVPCDACAVEAPGARTLLNTVAAEAERLGIPAYDEDRRRGELRYAIVRMGWRSSDIMLTLVTRSRNVPRLDELATVLMQAEPRLVCVAQNINPRVTNALLGGETRILCGAPRMRDELLSCTFEISPTAFYQTNPQQTEVLYREAIHGMELCNGDTVLDAYCGSGTIGLCAAASARESGKAVQLIGVERNPSGVEDAHRNAELNNLAADATFIAQDATFYLQRAAADGTPVDVLIMDPPRAGSTLEFLAAAAALNPRRIVYISCSPVTQARDLEQLGQAGYQLMRLVPVDMFPHTSHVETVATLSATSF